MMKISLTGVNAASRDLSVISNNLANSLTTGFKRSMSQITDVASSSLSTRPGAETGQGALTETVSRSLQQGTLESTNNQLDLAISGAGYFTFGEAAAAASQGEGSYTFSRAGKLTISASGAITNQNGSPLLGLPLVGSNAVGGTPLPINVSAAVGKDFSRIQSVSIDSSGVLSVQTTDGKNVRVAAVALANFRNEQGLKSSSGAELKETDTSGAAEFSQPNRNGMGLITQGSLEGANVDMTAEMLHMIQAQQAYNGNARALQTNSEMLRSTIETLTR